jgi:hypothetical protein
MFDGIAVTLVRELCGDAVADALGVEQKDWTRHLMGPMRWLFNATDGMQDVSRVAAKLSGAYSRRLLEGLHNTERGGKRVTFRIPQSLQDSWSIGAE